MVAYYTSATGKWTGPVVVGTNPLTNDDHGAPVILVDNKGYIHVMYGAHDSALNYAKSTKPEDISAWTAMNDPVNQIRGATYPYLFKDVSGNIWLVYRTARIGGPSWNNDLVEATIESTDGGLTWSPPHDLVDLYAGSWYDRIYVLGGVQYDSARGRVNLAWAFYNNTLGQMKDVYYAYLNLASGNMFSITGKNLGTTIDKTAADTYCKVTSSGKGSANFINVKADSSGNPYLLYETSSGCCDWGWKYNFTRWTGSTWSTPITIRTAGDSDGNEFFIHSGTSIEAYLVNPVSSRGGDIEQWSWDGSKWTKVSTLLAQSQVSYPLNIPMASAVVNGVDLKIVFCAINTGTGQYTVSNLPIFASGTKR
jgi:hypothetical protein